MARAFDSGDLVDNRYKIVRGLGAGGMGAVYEVERITDGKHFALKVLRGEVSGTAIEQSLSGIFRFVVHKGKTITAPRVETNSHYILVGIDADLNRALRMAVREVINFLVAERGLTPAKAFSLASIAVDFHVAEAVDLTQLVSAKIPKSLFLKR